MAGSVNHDTIGAALVIVEQHRRQDDAIELEALAQLLDPGSGRRRAAGIPLEHVGSGWAAIGGTEQAVVRRHACA